MTVANPQGMILTCVTVRNNLLRRQSVSLISRRVVVMDDLVGHIKTQFEAWKLIIRLALGFGSG